MVVLVLVVVVGTPCELSLVLVWFSLPDIPSTVTTWFHADALHLFINNSYFLC